MRTRDWIALAAVLLLGLGLRFPVAGIVLERDEGGYAYIAQRWLQGEVPYQQSFDQKPPGVYAAYAVIERTLGTSPQAIHWGAQLYTLLTLAAVFLLGRRLFGEAAGFAAGAWAALMTVDHGFLGNAANTETFMLLPLTAGLGAALLAKERGSWRWAAACGACSGLALLFKQVAVTDAVLYLALLGFAGAGRGLLFAAFFAGAAAVWTPVAAYFAATGAASHFFDCVIGYNLNYAAGLPLAAYFVNFWTTFSRTIPALWPIYLLALAGGVMLEGTGGPIVLAWLACSMLGACPGGFFRPHYYLQAVPALALLAAGGASELCRRWSLPRPTPYILTTAVLLCGIWSGSWYYGPGSPTAKCRKLYGANPFPEAVDTARLIAQLTTPQDRVFVFGSEPEILYYAGRQSATRYIYVYPLFLPSSDAAARQQEMLLEARAAHPKIIVTVFSRTSFLASIRSPLAIFSQVKELLQGYQLAAVVLSNPRNPTQLIIAQEARRMWKELPMWYDRPLWGTLAVWERKS